MFESIAARWPGTAALANRALQSMPRGRWRDALRLNIYRRAYQALTRRDWELNTAVHHRERFTLTGDLGRFLPDAKPVYRGVEGYIEAMELWLSTWEEMRSMGRGVEVHDAPDGRVVSIHRWLARGERSGVELDVRLADVETFERGWMTSQTLFTEPNAALRFAGLDPTRIRR